MLGRRVRQPLLLVLIAAMLSVGRGHIDGGSDSESSSASSLSSSSALLERRAHGRRLSSACAARGRSLTGCPLDPQSTAGPFATDEGLVRQDITEDRPGVPMVLDVELVNSSNCAALADAAIEIWHCDAVGEYSAFPTPSDTTFMRGVQFTNASGVARFVTVFPGWYVARVPDPHWT
jgi:protocatechuate 3,4-dioxygenase beta subunit